MYMRPKTEGHSGGLAESLKEEERIGKEDKEQSSWQGEQCVERA